MLFSLKDVTLFYEQVGNGDPILLLHGNGESHEIYDKLIAKLSESFVVYALDSRSQGNSQKTKHISYELMAADTASFIKAMGLSKPIVYGFSDGGIIGLLLAINYPDSIGKLVTSGANVSPKGLTKSFLRTLRFITFFNRSPLMALMKNEPDISASQLLKIKIPVVLLAGEKDVVRQEHTRYIASKIKDSTVEFIKNETHSSYVLNNTKLYEILAKYL